MRAHTVEPRVQLVDPEGVVEAHHGRAVLDRGEQQRRRAGDAPGGRVRAHELGVGVLEEAQLADQGVVVGVGDLGGVELVVALVVVVDEPAQLLDPSRRRLRRPRHRPSRERTGR